MLNIFVTKERHFIVLLFFVFLGLLTSFFYSEVLNLKPCVLCMIERFTLIFIFINLILLHIVITKARVLLINLLLISTSLLILIFFGLSLWHSYIQAYPFSFSCSNAQLLSGFKLTFQGLIQSNDCSEIQFKVFGLSIPNQLIIYSLILLILFFSWLIRWYKN